MAPSAGNCQPWFIYVVKNQKVRQELAKAAFNQGFLVEAPVNIVVCAEPKRSFSRYGERGASLYCLQDTAALVQSLLLMAEGLGLSTCWVGAFDEQAVRQVLEIPEDVDQWPSFRRLQQSGKTARAAYPPCSERRYPDGGLARTNRNCARISQGPYR